MNLDPLRLNQNTDPLGLNNYPAPLILNQNSDLLGLNYYPAPHAVDMRHSAPPSVSAPYRPSAQPQTQPNTPTPSGGFFSDLKKAGTDFVDNISNPKPSAVRDRVPILGSLLNVSGSTGKLFGDIVNAGLKKGYNMLPEGAQDAINTGVNIITDPDNPVVDATTRLWHALPEGTQNDIGNLVNTSMLIPGVQGGKALVNSGKILATDGIEALPVVRDALTNGGREAIDTWKMKSPQAIDQIADSEKGTLYKPQTIDGSAVPGSNFKEGIGRYNDGDVVGRISPEHAAEITSIGQYKAFNPAEMPKNFVTSPDGKIDFGNIPAEIEEKSGGKYPEASIRMEEGAKEDYGRSHIGEERIKEIKDAGYKDELDMLSDVAKNYTQIYEQPNGRLLLVKKNGKSKYAVVELQKNPDNYYGTTTMFFDEKPLRGKPYEERSGRKLLLDVARTPDSGQSVPFPIAGVEDRADNSRRWDKSSSLTHGNNIATQTGNVNKNSIANDTGSAIMRPTGGNISDAARQQLEKIINGQSNIRGAGGIPSSEWEQGKALQSLTQTFRSEGYNIKNSGTLLKEIDDYLSSTNIPPEQQAQIKQKIVEGIRKNSQMGKIVPPRTISGQ